jgi:hypothetical protein
MMSLRVFREDFTRRLLNLLWKQWAELGVFGAPTGADVKTGRPPAVIDPEALLLASLELGRMEPRLYDEVLSWLATQSEWINMQRLGNLLRRQPDLDRSLLAAPAAWLWKTTQDIRWKRLSGAAPSRKPTALFLDLSGQALPSLGETDPEFRRSGWLRSPVHRRDWSSGSPVVSAGTSWLKLRYLFGLNARADVIVYLLTHDSAHPPELSRAVHYSQPSLFRACQELELSGTVHSFRQVNQRRYRLDPERWRTFLQVKPFRWVSWAEVFPLQQRLWRFLFGQDWRGVSDYLQASELRSALQEASSTVAVDFLPTDFRKLFDIPSEAFVATASELLTKWVNHLSAE